MESFFFGIGHFAQATFQILVMMGWAAPTVFIVVMLFGMAFWLRTQTVLSRKAKERGDFI
jgi:hypothetical protein